jgi:exodeoxyribonuclease VIII
MHIMIDLETMGNRPNAPIIAIGAVAFDANGIDREFYEVVDLDSAVRSGAVIDPSTVMWWLQQSDEARTSLFVMDGVTLSKALDKFSLWATVSDITGVWGNGATFDNVILAESYRRLDKVAPWPFWKDKCYRTVKGMYPDVRMERSGTHHNALDDAKSQALHLVRINDEFGNFL